MPSARFDWLLIVLAMVFVALFAVVVVPPFIDDGLDVVGAFEAAFVNPYASGFAIDLIVTYAILFAWVVYESVYRGVRHGWVALFFGAVIGVAVGLVLYLLIRHREIGPQTWR